MQKKGEESMSQLMASADRKERIKQAIILAFAEAVYPVGEGIALHPETFDGEEIEESFKGHHWRDLPRETVRRRSAVFLRPEARHFYMPAFLLAALDTLPKETVDLDLYTLKPPEDDRRFRQEYDPYTKAHKEAIRLFLEYVRDSNPEAIGCGRDAQEALDQYWGSDGAETPGG